MLIHPNGTIDYHPLPDVEPASAYDLTPALRVVPLDDHGPTNPFVAAMLDGFASRYGKRYDVPAPVGRVLLARRGDGPRRLAPPDPTTAVQIRRYVEHAAEYLTRNSDTKHAENL
ncbi:hypothetical protein [Rhodococcus globerulus]|uniref:hypothetical protein n=1 Tax=Rhodococcus globerulus TaxID=33008 RepID=UPI003017AE54